MTFDPYVDLQTGILKNKLEIIDQNLLDTVERQLTTLRIKELAEKPFRGKFNFAYLKKTHKYIFQDIYDWAGLPRTVDMGKEGT